MKKVAVLLAGSGHQDGSEIHETVFALAALSEKGVLWDAFSLNKKQTRVINHATSESCPSESRSMLSESARISRSRIFDLKNLAVQDYSALIIPGGFGVAFNLCSFAVEGQKMSVDPEVERVIRAFHETKKPIGAICIAPILLARVLGASSPKITLGAYSEASQAAEQLGARHEVCSQTDFVADRSLGLFTTPAYMYDNAKMCEVQTGIKAMVFDLLASVRQDL